MISIRTLNNRIARIENLFKIESGQFYYTLDALTRLKLLRCVSDDELNRLKELHPHFRTVNSKQREIKEIEFNHYVKYLFEKYEKQIAEVVISNKEWNDNKAFDDFVATQPEYEIEKFLSAKIPNPLDTFLEQLN